MQRRKSKVLEAKERNAEAQRRFREAHAERRAAARTVYNILMRRARWLSRPYDLAAALRACLTDAEVVVLCARLAPKAKRGK
jgi:hypothetical protein